MFKAKIVVIGPCESGKTWISNFLAEASESSGGEYHPTQGVRILEFESEGEDPATGRTIRAEVELWDCGAKREFESCWPAICRDTSGVLLVYNPDRDAKHLAELEKLFSYFVSRQGLDANQCLLFAHHRPNTPVTVQQPPASQKLSNIPCVFTDLEDESHLIRKEFNSFLVTLITKRKDRQTQDELGIVNNVNSH